MATGFQPVGAALPPRRDSLVSAAAVSVVNDAAPSRADWGDSINVPLARDRMLEYFEREQLPGDVRATLAAALHGDLHLQSMLFNAMLDTWPKLQKAIEEIGRKVSVAPWKVHPFAKRGEKPSPKAESVAKEFEALIWGMKPRAARMESGLEDTIKDLVRAYYYGHGVNEIRWSQNQDGEWAPRCTKAVPARFFGYPADYGLQEDPEDRLMFDPEGGMGIRRFVDFPESRFLVAIHRGHSGHPSLAAPLRALTAYWLAAVYGLKWFMNFTQLYGIPWRHAEVGDAKDENAVKNAIASIGSNGYIVTKPGTKINILAPGSTTAASLPQRELVALADQQCDQFILGQTLTSGVSADGGSRALGEVHQDTLDGVVDGLADFVGGVLTHQLIPAIAAANWGDSLAELPEIWAKREEAKDEKSLAERDEKIGVTSGKVPVGKAWFYERHGIPMPAAGDELLIDQVEDSQIDPNAPAKLGPDGKPVPAAVPAVKKPVEAADASDWKDFKGSLGIPRREMPQIASGNRGAMVGFLRARGIESKRETVPAKSLKPTQLEYSPGKVQAAKEYKGGNRAILISEDDRVVDGHHQWLASADDDKDIEVIRLMAPISRVLMMAHRMPSTSVAAADTYATGELSTIDQLSASVLEGLTGVSREWLSPVRPFFDRLAALAMSKQVTDDDFMAALEKAQKELPEIFDIMDTRALEDAFMNAISSGALAGSVSRYE
jgi:phage gp29-like protein